MIYCIGDSHIGLFSGVDAKQPIWPQETKDILPYFKTYKVGPALAYNLCQENTKTMGREKLFEILQQIPHGSKVMFCFGEIDCRLHLLKQHNKQKRLLQLLFRKERQSLESIVQKCVDRYFSVLKEVENLGFQILVWNAVASTTHNISDKEWPTYGSCEKRNQVTKLFNDYSKHFCKMNKWKFISIFEELIDKNGLTKMDFYRDAIHLSQKVMPLVKERLQL